MDKGTFNIDNNRLQAACARYLTMKDSLYVLFIITHYCSTHSGNWSFYRSKKMDSHAVWRQTNETLLKQAEKAHVLSKVCTILIHSQVFLFFPDFFLLDLNLPFS